MGHTNQTHAHTPHENKTGPRPHGTILGYDPLNSKEGTHSHSDFEDYDIQHTPHRVRAHTRRVVGGWGRDPFSRNFMKPTPRRKWHLTTGRRFHWMVLDPIPQSFPKHFFGSRPQPPTSPLDGASHWCWSNTKNISIRAIYLHMYIHVRVCILTYTIYQ